MSFAALFKVRAVSLLFSALKFICCSQVHRTVLCTLALFLRGIFGWTEVVSSPWLSWYWAMYYNNRYSAHLLYTVCFSVLVLWPIVIVSVSGGGGDKPERKRSNPEKSSSNQGVDKRSKKHKSDGDGVGVLDGNIGTSSDPVDLAGGAVAATSSANFGERGVVIDTFGNGFGGSEAIRDEHFDDDEERQMHDFMLSLHSQPTSGSSPNPATVDGSRDSWAPASNQFTDDPMRLRLRQIRTNNDGGSMGASSLGLPSTSSSIVRTAGSTGFSTFTSNQQQQLLAPGSAPLTWSTTGHQDIGLAYLNQRMDQLQNVLEQFVTAVTPLVQRDIQDRNNRLGPDVRLRTTSPTVWADSIRQRLPLPTSHSLQTAQRGHSTITTSQQLQDGQQSSQHLHGQQSHVFGQAQQLAVPNPLANRQPLQPQINPNNFAVPSQPCLPLQDRSGLSSAMVPFAGRSGLPPLDNKTLRAIKDGEYINFNTILSATSFEAALLEDDDDDTPFSLTMDTNDKGKRVLDFKPRSKGRSKVKNFQSWLIAFTWYMRAVAFYHSYLLGDLVQYQGIIANFATQYAPAAWLNYDRAFRRRVAMVPSTPWYVVDEEIFSYFLRGAPPAASRVVGSTSSSFVGSSSERCYRCRGFGHRCWQCPTLAASSGSGLQSRSLSTAVTHVLPRRPLTAPSRFPAAAVAQSSMQRTGHCFAYNGGYCPRGEQSCTYRHVCGTCGTRGHIASACPQPARSDAN